MSDQPSTPKRTPWWQRLLLVGIGIAVALGMVQGLLLLAPHLLNDPAAREEAGTTLEVEFTYLDGDLWVHRSGRIRPPEENVVLGRYVLSWDENGFRVPAMTADHYPIAAFGDSYTEGTTVARPWTDGLAAALGVPVRNFGYRGYGPKEHAATAEEFLAQQERSWVLYAHFSGNDLNDAHRSVSNDLLARSPFGLVTWIGEQTAGTVERSAPISEDGQYDWPMPVIIGSRYYEQVFLEDNIGWQLAPEEGFLASRTMSIVGDALDTVAEQASDGSCRALIFVPSKGQLYYPYIHPNSRRWLRELIRRPQLLDSGLLTLDGDAISAEDEQAVLIDHLGDQRDAMRELADAHGWLFIDLLEPFQEAAAQGEMLYYTYDGHWNQDGHDLAAQIIADFMRAHRDDCPLE